jgi:hypothetical protein
MFAVHSCCQLSVALTALESRQRRGGRTEFCDFLVCPEFLLKRRLPFGGVGPTCCTGPIYCTGVNTQEAGEVFRLLPRTAFASVLLLPGGVDNHAVVNRPQPELKTNEDQFPDLGKPGSAC